MSLKIQTVSHGRRGIGSNILYVGFDGFAYIMKHWPEEFKKATRGMNPTYERIGPIAFNLNSSETVDLRQFEIAEPDPRIRDVAFQIFLTQTPPLASNTPLEDRIRIARHDARTFLDMMDRGNQNGML